MGWLTVFYVKADDYNISCLAVNCITHKQRLGDTCGQIFVAYVFFISTDDISVVKWYRANCCMVHSLFMVSSVAFRLRSERYVRGSGPKLLHSFKSVIFPKIRPTTRMCITSMKYENTVTDTLIFSLAEFCMCFKNKRENNTTQT